MGGVADPYGLWEAPRLAVPGAQSFSAPGAAVLSEPVLRWSLDLAAPGALQRRADQLDAIEAGMRDSEARLDAYLRQHVVAQGRGPRVSYSLSSDPAEASLDALLANLPPLNAAEPAVPPAGMPGRAVDFGWRDTLDGVVSKVRAQVERVTAASQPWKEMQNRLASMLTSLEHQMLYYAWVETRSGPRLLARTSVTWGGDALTLWQNALPPVTVSDHYRNLQLATASRAANMRTFLTITRLASKIILAGTPLGPVQALSLAWEFLDQVIKPLMEEARQKA